MRVAVVLERLRAIGRCEVVDVFLVTDEAVDISPTNAVFDPHGHARQDRLELLVRRETGGCRRGIPADEVAGEGKADRGSDPSRATDPDGGTDRHHDRLDGGIALGIDIHLAGADDHAADRRYRGLATVVDEGVGPTEDHVSRNGSGAAHSDAGLAAAADGERCRGRRRVDPGDRLGVDHDIADGGADGVVGTTDEALDVVANAVFGQRDSDR